MEIRGEFDDRIHHLYCKRLNPSACRYYWESDEVLVMNRGLVIVNKQILFFSEASPLSLSFESISYPGGLCDSTKSAALSKAEEEEFHITGTEFLDEIQL